MKSFSCAALAAVVVLSACAARQPVTATPCCAYGVGVADRLYFGRDIQGQDSVTEARWSQFVATVVAPAFPNAGWTVYRVDGYWHDPNGSLTIEKTFVFERLHVLDARADSLMNHIARAYITAFRQQAVLRMKSPATAELIEAR